MTVRKIGLLPGFTMIKASIAMLPRVPSVFFNCLASASSVTAGTS